MSVCSGLIGWNILSVISNACFPDMRITAIPPTPAGVDIAQMFIVCMFMECFLQR